MHTGTFTAVTGTVVPSPTGYGSIGAVSSSTLWNVFVGPVPLTPKGFATLTNDRAGLARLKKHNQNTAVASVVLAGVSVLGVASGAYLLNDPEPTDAEIAGGLALMLGPGAIGGGIALGLPLRNMVSKSFGVATRYTPKQAAPLIDAYNAKLRDRLGLSEDDVLAIDTTD